MSILSEKLTSYMELRGISLLQLSKMCQIERSTLYQYLKGKRSLKNREHFECIMEKLCLMPEEVYEFRKAYEVELVGEKLYHQHVCLSEFLNELPIISESEILRKEVTYDIPQIYEGKQRVLKGKLKVKQVIFQMLKDVYLEEGEVKIYFPALCDDLIEQLGIFFGGKSRCQITHIVNMEPDGNQCIQKNLKRIKHVMECCSMAANYESLYYYGHGAERFGSISILPGLIVTERAALQISSDGKLGIYYTGEDEVVLFTELFEGMESHCKSLMHYQEGVDNVIGLGFQDFGDTDFKETLEMCSGLCSMQFWSKDLIQNYLNPNIPNFENVLEVIGRYCSWVYEKKSQGHTRVMMKESSILEFIHTGRFSEYPTYYFRGPLEKKDRRELLEKLLKAYEEGWYEFCIVEEKNFPIGGEWEFIVNRRDKVIIQNFLNDTCKVFVCTETGIVEALYEYMEYFSNTYYVKSPEDSVIQLKAWIKKYLYFKGE